MKRKLLISAGLALLVSTATTGKTPSPYQTLKDDEFKPIPTTKSSAVIIDRFDKPQPYVKPSIEIPELSPKVIIKVTKPVDTNNKVKGLASWYCRAGISVCHYKYPDRRGVLDFYAAAGPALRIGKWRGRIVNVCGVGGCFKVRLVDWCQCYKGQRHEKIIDLYYDAYKAITRGGSNRVTVSW